MTDTLVGSNSNRIEASYEDFPQDLIDAFVSIEDSRFWQHSGIDLRSISRAVVGVLTNAIIKAVPLPTASSSSKIPSSTAVWRPAKVPKSNENPGIHLSGLQLTKTSIGRSF